MHALRVLVVDDNASARDIFHDMLGSMQVKAICVTDGIQALIALEQAQQAGEPFELVLVDWHMPSIDGVETVRRIQSDPNLATTPMCMMVTAHSREELLRQVESSGISIDGLLIKPVGPSTLYDSIVSALGNDAGQHHRTLVGRVARADVEAALRGTHILLVEDNDMNRQFAMEVLGRAGIQVDVAGNGQEALEKIDCFHYDGVLMDCQMPIMDGFEATRRIRVDGRFAELPVIAMTANAMAGDRERCAAAGMNDHIAKPIDIDLMFLTLARWIKPRVGTNLSFAMPCAPPLTTIPSIAELDLATVMGRLGGDGDLFHSMLGWFHKDQSAYAASMQAALAEGDRLAAQRLAHTLKGAADGIGAVRLFQAAERLEQALRWSPDSVPPALFDTVEDLLLLQLAEIERALGPVAGASRATNSPDGEAALIPLLREMAKLLADDDAQAMELNEPLAALVEGGALAEDFRRLAELIESYSLNEALAVLHGIAKEMNIQLD